MLAGIVAEAVEFEVYEARRQDVKNRQNSIDDMSAEDKEWFRQTQELVNHSSFVFYKQAIERGIAKEQARFLLPMSTQTTLYMQGTIRSWIHYIQVRAGEETQKEHRVIAQGALEVLRQVAPITAAAFFGEHHA